MAHKDVVGSWGESYAAEWLSDAGCEVLARNLRTSAGEVDVLFVEDDVLVVGEVKTRTSARAGTAAEAIDAVRIQRLRNAAQLLALEYPQYRNVRVDAITIDVSNGVVALKHVRGIE